MKFIVDTMLGTLAKWLLVLGYDTIYARDLDDDEIIIIAQTQARIIISRDRELCKRVTSSIFFDSTDLDEQILKVINLYPPEIDKLLTRCIECNSMLESASKESLRKIVPTTILVRHDEFWRCTKCGKIFWKGSHFLNMQEKAIKLLNQCLS